MRPCSCATCPTHCRNTETIHPAGTRTYAPSHRCPVHLNDTRRTCGRLAPRNRGTTPGWRQIPGHDRVNTVVDPAPKHARAYGIRDPRARPSGMASRPCLRRHTVTVPHRRPDAESRRSATPASFARLAFPARSTPPRAAFDRPVHPDAEPVDAQTHRLPGSIQATTGRLPRKKTAMRCMTGGTRLAAVRRHAPKRHVDRFMALPECRHDRQPSALHIDHTHQSRCRTNHGTTDSRRSRNPQSDRKSAVTP